MKPNNNRVLGILPYVGLALALVISTWTFLRSEQYRSNTENALSESYEIQWGASQIRERLLRATSYIRIASQSGELDPDIDRQVMLLRFNIKQLLSLSYVDRFLSPSDIKRLEYLNQAIKQKLDTTVAARSNYQQILDYMAELEQEIYQISSAVLNHSAGLQETAKINIDASRNWFIFALGLGLFATFYLIIHQRYVCASRRNQHLRSFASLFAHMTRSRVTALRLFLANTGSTCPGDELLNAARSTASELEAINDGLLSIAYSERNPESEPLGRVLHKVIKGRADIVKLEIGLQTTQLLVPKTQFQMMINELVQNAETAVKGRKNPNIVIRTSIKRRYFGNRSHLIVEVEDNGVGMLPDIMKKATIPFFSTKAGKHLGLGLTSCAEMISTLGGKLTIDSKPDHGTIVQVRVPCPRNVNEPTCARADAKTSSKTVFPLRWLSHGSDESR
ncbi:sensor histidine kinase [Phyllobacterium salinisoli]|uniref:histidine kinase n=1 Tax=Phyllobacterium salinisoli TaxID=1899321 RepID=A0A368K085_9HYPH|nr:HAMP domain-containing sensor histidine kinase [Phyllobacterium salinisoli]RCS21370.1 sensor histidine kinase [Phyllobacterium salinisoli]